VRIVKSFSKGNHAVLVIEGETTILKLTGEVVLSTRAAPGVSTTTDGPLDEMIRKTAAAALRDTGPDRCDLL
jgi:hypothetical protein